MKKSIKVKGAIKVDKTELKKVRAGSCSQYGVVCETDLVKVRQVEMLEAAPVDRLYIV